MALQHYVLFAPGPQGEGKQRRLRKVVPSCSCTGRSRTNKPSTHPPSISTRNPLYPPCWASQPAPYSTPATAAAQLIQSPAPTHCSGRRQHHSGHSRAATSDDLLGHNTWQLSQHSSGQLMDAAVQLRAAQAGKPAAELLGRALRSARVHSAPPPTPASPPPHTHAHAHARHPAHSNLPQRCCHNLHTRVPS